MENGSASASVHENVIENAFKIAPVQRKIMLRFTMLLGRMEHDFKEEKPKRNAMVWGLGKWSAQVRK